MSPQEVADFTRAQPYLYHLSAVENRASIERHGLLSTSALLDLHGVAGPARAPFEQDQRRAALALPGAAPPVVLRDQIPLVETKLAACLRDGLTPRDWRLMLNSRVFFFPSLARVQALLGASVNRGRPQLLISLHAAAVLAAYAQAITLSPLNSGSVLYVPQPRGLDTHARIPDFAYAAWRGKRGRPDRAIAEIAVDYAMPDAARFIDAISVVTACPAPLAERDKRRTSTKDRATRI